MTDVSARAIGYLEAWFSQKPTFALMGEFSAGKSTLLNLILGETVLPTQVTATSMPVIWMTYGDTPTAESLSYDGQLRSFDLADLRDQGAAGHLLIRLALPSETLKRSDVIDTPGISDRRLSSNALDFIKPYLDFVVWCSAANQAWRQSEKAVWQKMPQEMQDLSILALTRADMMKKANTLEKVIKRCETETAGMFRIVQPIATVVALGAMDDHGDVVDQDAWTTSFADALFVAIKDSLRIANLNCALRDAVDVPEESQAAIEIPTITSEATDNEPKMPDQVAPTEEFDGAAIDVDTLLGQLRHLPDKSPTKEQFFNTLDHLLTEFKSDKDVSDAHRTVLDRAMSLDGSKTVPPQLVVAQLVREIEDFANKPWCQLD
ncbi:MAG: dynamin family protein [Pseudomonadota bacterium]